VSPHKIRPAQAVAGRTGEEPLGMVVVAGSRAAGMKSCRSCPATYRSAAVVVVCRVVGGSVGGVVFDPAA
jgi:hypothetical protein